MSSRFANVIFSWTLLDLEPNHDSAMVLSPLPAMPTTVSHVFFTGKYCVWIAKPAIAKGSNRSRIHCTVRNCCLRWLFLYKDKGTQRKEFEYALPLARRKKKHSPAESSKSPPRCRLRLLKMKRIKDYMLLENTSLRIRDVSVPKSRMKKSGRRSMICAGFIAVRTLEEITNSDHEIAIIASGPEYYAPFVDKNLLEPGCTILLYHRMHTAIGFLQDEMVLMVSVMKLEKASMETYGDIGGLDQDIQEIKVRIPVDRCILAFF